MKGRRNKKRSVAGLEGDQQHKGMQVRLATNRQAVSHGIINPAMNTKSPACSMVSMPSTADGTTLRGAGRRCSILPAAIVGL